MSYQEKYSYSKGPKFIPFNDEVVSYLASMFFRCGSPFLESFNRIIYRVVETGMVQKFWKDINLWDVKDDDEDKDADGAGSDAVVLTVTHLQGEFILLLLGLTLGLTVFTIELICFCCRKYRFYPLLITSGREFKN
jgi:hypothetical protein